MTLHLRGWAWSGLYAALVSPPVIAAVLVDPFTTTRPASIEISVALGLFAIPLVTMQFALVSRLRAASVPFGTDALMQWHQYIGVLGLALVLVHPLLLNAAGLPWAAWNPFGGSLATRSGVAATSAIALIALTTVARARLRLSYEAWRNLHVALATGTAIAIALHVVAVGGYARAPILKTICLLYVAVFGTVGLHYRVFRPLRLRATPWEITDNRDEGASIRTLRVMPLGHDGFAFAPGQFAWLITGTTPWSSQQHPLSISSSAFRTSGGEIEFSIKALGDWSSQTVPHLRAGTRVWIDGPFGAFTTDRAAAAPGIVLIAGGIGIAPLRSMLLTMRDRHDTRPVVLVYAAHDETRVAFASEFEALRAPLNLTVVYVLEEPRGILEAEAGPVSVDLLRRCLPPSFRDCAFFVCGPAPMMDAVEAMLLDLDVPRRAIDIERFRVV